MIIHPDELQRLKKMELWLRGLLARYDDVWKNVEQITERHGETCGSVGVVTHFTPIAMVGVQATIETTVYICELDEAMDEAIEQSSEEDSQRIRGEIMHCFGVLAVQWQSIHRANCGLFSAWAHIGVHIQHPIPSVTLSISDEGDRPMVVDTRDSDITDDDEGESSIH